MSTGLKAPPSGPVYNHAYIRYPPPARAHRIPEKTDSKLLTSFESLNVGNIKKNMVNNQQLFISGIRPTTTLSTILNNYPTMKNPVFNEDLAIKKNLEKIEKLEQIATLERKATHIQQPFLPSLNLEDHKRSNDAPPKASSPASGVTLNNTFKQSQINKQSLDPSITANSVNRTHPGISSYSIIADSVNSNISSIGNNTLLKHSNTETSSKKGPVDQGTKLLTLSTTAFEISDQMTEEKSENKPSVNSVDESQSAEGYDDDSEIKPTESITTESLPLDLLTNPPLRAAIENITKYEEEIFEIKKQQEQNSTTFESFIMNTTVRVGDLKNNQRKN